MKKIYNSPVTVTVKLHTRHMVCGSPGLKASGYNSESESLSRRNSVWEDDEE